MGGDVVCRVLITLPVYPEPDFQCTLNLRRHCCLVHSGRGGVLLASSSSTVLTPESIKDLNNTGGKGSGW